MTTVIWIIFFIYSIFFMLVVSDSNPSFALLQKIVLGWTIPLLLLICWHMQSIQLRDVSEEQVKIHPVYVINNIAFVIDEGEFRNMNVRLHQNLSNGDKIKETWREGWFFGLYHDKSSSWEIE